MKKLLAKTIAAAVEPKADAVETEISPLKWLFGSVVIPKDKAKETK
ncbi:hypothetical protein [Paenibacillus kobensis]|nr:hypothetical protein [Paenibacillus kobensis]